MKDKGRDVVWNEACDLSESSTFGINIPCYPTIVNYTRRKKDRPP